MNESTCRATAKVASGGKPIVRDLRVSVESVLILLAQGIAPEAILDDYPDLEPDDIRACTAYAHAVIALTRHSLTPEVGGLFAPIRTGSAVAPTRPSGHGSRPRRPTMSGRCWRT